MHAVGWTMLGLSALCAPLCFLRPRLSPVLLLFAGVSLASGATSLSGAARALLHLAPASLFLIFLMPAADLLRRAGVFSAAADLISRVPARLALPLSWTVAAATTAIFNIDTTVVMLTPAYLLLKESDDRFKRFDSIPLILSILASGFIPASNLTNLVFETRIALPPLSFARFLALPSLAAVVVSYLFFSTLLAPKAEIAKDPVAEEKTSTALSKRALLIGGSSFCWLLFAFTYLRTIGVPEWASLALLDLFLLILTRTRPSPRFPFAALILVNAVGVIAEGVSKSVSLHLRGMAGEFSAFLIGAGSASVINNIPAALLTSSIIRTHSLAQPLAALLGTNLGVFISPSASVASLLWFSANKRNYRTNLKTFYTEIAPVLAVGAAAALLVYLYTAS